MNEDLYTKEDFKKIRLFIDEVFQDQELGRFNIRKSTYDYASKHDWLITVELKLNWYDSRDFGPFEKLDLMKKLFDKVYDFVNNKDFNYRFVNVYSHEGFRFEFQFKPLIVLANDLLSDRGR